MVALNKPLGSLGDAWPQLTWHFTMQLSHRGRPPAPQTLLSCHALWIPQMVIISPCSQVIQHEFH